LSGQEIKLGSFVAPAGVLKLKLTPDTVAIVIYDHGAQEVKDFYSIKWMSDGHVSNRHGKDLQILTPLQFCKIWCKKEMGYRGVKDEGI
jgi:hypothetical protein